MLGGWKSSSGSKVNSPNEGKIYTVPSPIRRLCAAQGRVASLQPIWPLQKFDTSCLELFKMEKSLCAKSPSSGGLWSPERSCVDFVGAWTILHPSSVKGRQQPSGNLLIRRHLLEPSAMAAGLPFGTWMAGSSNREPAQNEFRRPRNGRHG